MAVAARLFLVWFCIVGWASVLTGDPDWSLVLASFGVALAVVVGAAQAIDYRRKRQALRASRCEGAGHCEWTVVGHLGYRYSCRLPLGHPGRHGNWRREMM